MSVEMNRIQSIEGALKNFPVKDSDEVLSKLSAIRERLELGENFNFDAEFLDAYLCLAKKNGKIALGYTKGSGFTDKEQLAKIFRVANKQIRIFYKSKKITPPKNYLHCAKHDLMKEVIREELVKLYGSEEAAREFAPL